MTEHIKKIKDVDKKHGWDATLPYMLVYCALLFAKCFKGGLFSAFSDAVQGVGGELFDSFFSTGMPRVEAGTLINIARAGRALLPVLLLGGAVAGFPAWASVGWVKAALDLRKTIGIEKERARTLSKIPDEAKSKVNDKGIHHYLSYDNTLLRLYRGPNLMGELVVPEGIEAIGKHAFDDFCARGMSWNTRRIKRSVTAIVLPDTIKKLDPECLPKNTTIVFPDATKKAILHNVDVDYLKSKNITIKGGFFSEVLQECETLEHKSKEDNEVPSFMMRSEINRINAAFSRIDDPLIKIRLMDIMHSQILRGNLSISDFRLVLGKVDFEPKDRYCGKGVIERIYGSRQNAVDKFEFKYYEAENIRNRENSPEILIANMKVDDPKQTAEIEMLKMLDFIEDVAERPETFRFHNAKELETLREEFGDRKNTPVDLDIKRIAPQEPSVNVSKDAIISKEPKHVDVHPRSPDFLRY